MHADDISDVIQRYANGERSRTKLAAAAGCSRSKVDRLLMEAGFDLTPRNVTGVQREAMARAYGEGQSLKFLAVQWNLPESTVTAAIRSAGVKIRGRGRPKGRRQVNLLSTEQVLSAFDRGGIRMVAKEMNGSLSSAYRMYRHATGERSVP